MDTSRKLYLSRTDRKLAGVCGGIAEYLGVDSTVVRLVTVILAIATAVVPVIIAYFLAWIIMPLGPEPPART